MTPAEMRKLCEDAIARWEPQFSEYPFVRLVIPRMTCPTGAKIRLTPKGGPLGRIDLVHEPNGRDRHVFEVVTLFPAKPILKWLEDQGS